MKDPNVRGFLLVLKAVRRGKKVTITASPLIGKQVAYAKVGFPKDALAERWHRKISRNGDTCLSAFYKALKGKMA